MAAGGAGVLSSMMSMVSFADVSEIKMLMLKFAPFFTYSSSKVSARLGVERRLQWMGVRRRDVSYQWAVAMYLGFHSACSSFRE